MSNRILTAAWNVRGLLPTEKIILVRLADRADNDGNCFPGHKSIADDCGLSERTVRDTLPVIESKGHLTIKEESQRAHKGTSRFTYTVHPVTPETASAVTRETGATDTGKEALRQRKTTAPTPENAAPPILITSNNPKENHHVNLVKNADLTNLTASMASMERIAREIVSDKQGWFWDNCTVKPADISAASLKTVLECYPDRLTEKAIHEAWQEAVTRTHKATVDALANNSAAYCIGCFKEQLESVREWASAT